MGLWPASYKVRKITMVEIRLSCEGMALKNSSTNDSGSIILHFNSIKEVLAFISSQTAGGNISALSIPSFCSFKD